jgi:hypothetical protein
MCVRSPHGSGAVPSGLSVQSASTIKRFRMMWIWMGDADPADQAAFRRLDAWSATNFFEFSPVD